MKQQTYIWISGEKKRRFASTGEENIAFNPWKEEVGRGKSIKACNVRKTIADENRDPVEKQRDEFTARGPGGGEKRRWVLGKE